MFETIINWIGDQWVVVFASAGTVLIPFSVFYKLYLEKFLLQFLAKKYDSQLVELHENLEHRGKEIGALRNHISTIRYARHTKIDEKRLEATITIWKETIQLGRFKILAKMMENVDAKVAQEIIEKGGGEAIKIQQFFEKIFETTGLEYKKTGKIDFSKFDHDIGVCELFVSASTWETYDAYRAVLISNLINVFGFTVGLKGKFKKEGVPADRVKKALPHHSKSLDELGDYFTLFCVEELEVKLKIELKKELNPADLDIIELEKMQELHSKIGNLDYKINTVPTEVPAEIQVKTKS